MLISSGTMSEKLCEPVWRRVRLKALPFFKSSYYRQNIIPLSPIEAVVTLSDNIALHGLGVLFR